MYMYSNLNKILFTLNVSFKRLSILFKRDVCWLDFRSNFLVSIFILINTGKEVDNKSFKRHIFLSFFLFFLFFF